MSFYLIFIENIQPKTQKEISWLFSFDSMLRKVSENKDLWIELRHELQKRNVVTSLATKEVLTDFFKNKNERASE